MNSKIFLATLLSAFVVLPNMAKAEMSGSREAQLVKAQIVQRLNQLIARHESMSQDQIVVDYQQQIESQVRNLQSSGISRSLISKFQAYASKSLGEFETVNKSSIQALETADLQHVEAADNVIVYLTQHESRPGDRVNQNNAWWNTDFLPLAVVTSPQMLAQILVAIH